MSSLYLVHGDAAFFACRLCLRLVFVVVRQNAARFAAAILGPSWCHLDSLQHVFSSPCSVYRWAKADRGRSDAKEKRGREELLVSGRKRGARTRVFEKVLETQKVHWTRPFFHESGDRFGRTRRTKRRFLPSLRFRVLLVFVRKRREKRN